MVSTMTKNLTNLDFFKQNSFGDPILYKELLEIFEKTTPEMVGQLKIAAEQNNIGQLAKVAHKLKSNVQSVGLNEAYILLDKLENLDEITLNKGELDLLMSQIVKLCSVAVSEVKNELDRQ